MEDVLEIQDQTQAPLQEDPPRKKLYKGLVKDKLYSKSYDEFNKQYSTPEAIDRLHKGLVEEKLYSKSINDFNKQYFSDLTPTSKKKVGTIGFEESSLQAGNVLSQSDGVVGEEIPQIEMYTLPNGEMVETDPVSISRKYKELKDRKKTVTEGVGSSFGMGTGTTKEVEDEESQKAAKKLSGDFLGIDIEGIYEDTQGLSDDLVRVYNNDILPDREWNNQLYQRKLANIKWRSSFEKKLLEDVDKGNIDPDNYNRIKHGIEQLPISTGQGDYSNQRAAVKSLAADIREYGGENRDKLLKDFAVEVSKVYGNPDNKAEEKFKDSPESKYLNTDAQLGYQYLQDVSPDKAEQYKRLFIDPKSLKDNPDELRGYNHLMQTLEETGINLKQNAVTEELNSLNKQAKMNGGLTPEQIERATKLEKVNEELSAKRNELDSKYPDRIGDKIDDAVQEVMGQRFGGRGNLLERGLGYSQYLGGKTYTAFRNTAQGVWEAASTPFMSDESNTLRELAIMGQSLEDEKIYHKTDKNKALQYDTMVIQPELQKEVDLIKNNNLLTDDQKEQKLYKLFRENTDKFGRVPIKNGEFNINPSSILYGMTDLGTSLLPFVAIEAATGGIGGAGAGAKFLRTFTAAASSTFHDEYAAALMEGKSQSEAYRSAMASTAINSLAMAGAGTPTEIRAMASTKTSAGKLIKSMSDDAIESVLKKGTPKGLKAVSQNVKERLKATPKMIKQGVKTGAKFEAYMSAANAINGREQDFKRSLLAIGEFGILGAALGQAAFKTPTQLQKSAGLEFGKKPDEYIAIAESMKKDGQLTDAQLEQRTELIKSYGEAYKSLPKNLDEKQQREYLYQTVIKNEASKGKSNLPPKQAAEAEHQAMVADYKREIILDQPTEKELESRKSYLERMIELKDEEGKLVLDEKEAAKGKAEIEAIDTHLDTTKKEVKEEELPDLSQPIPELNVDNKGIPIGENVPPEVKGEPEKITQPIELSVEGKTTDVVVDEKTKQQLLDERFNKIKQIKDKAEGTREDRTKRYKELVNELGDETAALKKLQEEINARAKKEIDKLPELPKTENEVINEKGENDFEKIKKDLGFKSNDYSWGKSPMDEDMGDMLLSKDKESVIFIKPNEVEVYDEKNDQTDTITNGIKIELVSTKENSRGKGKAKEMIQKVTDWADKNGTDLHLDIAPQDKATTDSGLKKLYESFGFEFDGIHGIRKPKQSLSKQDKASNVLGKPSERKNNGLSFPINKNGKEVGSIVVSKRKGEGYSVAVVSMIETEQGKGLGKDAYRELNKKSIEDTGKPLRSGITINDKAKNLWESLVKIGEAEKINDESYQFKAVDQPLSKQESGGKAPVTKPEGKSDVVVDKASNVGGDVRTINDFANENESYRVIVGDEAFNDIIESGVVRTNADSKSKKEGGIDLGNRPTAFPSFSRGKASIEYAAENPNNYIIVTEDGSIQPSKSGRHGKGTTMFPTDENGNHLKELSGEKIKVYKHIGDGKYELVYENGKAVDQPLSKQESGVVGSEVITDKGKMGGAVTDKIEVNDVEVALPEKGFVISDVTLNEGEAKYKGSGQEIYKKALDEHGTLYSSFPISEDAMRVQNKLVEKGIAKIENITLSDGTEIRKITKAETKTGQGVPETETGDSGEKPPVDTEAGIYAEDKRTELSFRGLQEVATEFGLDDVNSRERKSDLQLFKDAETEIKKWVNEGSYQKNIETVIKDAAERKPISDTQRVILENHIHAERVKANEIAKQNGVNSKEFKDAVNEIDRITKAAITSRQEAGAALRIPTTANNNTASLADAIIATKESKNVSELTDTETAEVQKKYQAIEDANAKFQEYKAEAEAKFKEYQAKIEMLEAGKNTQKGKKTATDLKTEREDIKKSILEKWNKAKNVGIVNNPKEDLLIQLAPDIAKLMRNYYQDGVRQLGEMVDKIHTYLKDLGVGVEASDVQDMIAGKYNQKKLTKNEMVAEIKGLQDEAKALNELKSLMNKEPRNEKEKRKKNERLAEIRKQINALKKEQGLDQYSDQAKVDRAIAANKAKEEKFKEKLAKGDFEKQPKHKTIYEAKEWQRQNPSLYKKLLDSQAKADQARADFEAGLIENEMKNAGLGDKFRAIAKKSSGTLKQLFASFDLSAIAVQNLPFILTQPKTSAKGLPKSFVHMVSQKQFDRMITELHNSPDWQIIKDSGLRVTEPKSLLEATREDYFPDRFKAIVKINGKEYGWVNVGGHKYELLDLSKPFERQFTSLGNLLRVVKFRTEAEILKSKGITFENSPEEYKTLAKRLNNLTSSSDIPAAYQNEITRTMIWSSRLVAAKLNMLGISDVAALIPGTGVKKGYYRGLGVKGQKISRQQAMAVYDLAKFATSVIALTYLVALIKGGTVNTNPTSNQFMDVEYDDGKSMNLTGGFSPYIAKLFQFANWGKTDKYGVFKPYKGTDPIKESITFMASKAPPVTRSVENIVAGKDQFGQDSDVSTEASKYKMPLAIGQIYDQIQKDGAGALFTEGIPTLIGFNSKDNRNYNTHNFSKDTEKFIVENQVPISMPKKVYTKNGEKMEMTEDEYKDLLKQVDKEIDNIASDIKNNGGYVIRNKEIVELPYSKLTKDEIAEMTKEMITEATAQIRKDKFKTDEETEEYIEKSTLEEILRQTRKASQESKPKKPEK